MLDTIESNIRPKRPDNTFTKDEYAARYKIARSTACVRIKQLINEGLVEVKGSERNTVFYGFC